MNKECNERYYNLKLTQEEINTLKIALADALLECKKNKEVANDKLEDIFLKNEKKFSNLIKAIDVCMRY